MDKNTSCDASVVINFLRINRIDLLENVSNTLFITDHVQEEITIYYPKQKALLEKALERKILYITNVETPEEYRTFAELSRSGQLGAGECAAISIAHHRGYFLAIDDNQAVKKSSHLIGSNCIFRTQDLILRMIQEQLLNVEEADKIREIWEKEHRFKLKINSFSELIAPALKI